MFTDFNNLFKIRVSTNTDSSMHKHDIIKLMLVRKLLNKHKKERTYIRIYTELPLENGRICDVYYENIKDKSVYVYEIQKEVNTKWKNDITNSYKEFEVLSAKTTDLVIINLNEFSDDINQINKELNKYIY